MIVNGVHLTRTGVGYQAQGLHLHLVEDSPAYWAAGRIEPEDTGAARTLTRLVGYLVANDELTKDALA